MEARVGVRALAAEAGVGRAALVRGPQAARRETAAHRQVRQRGRGPGDREQPGALGQGPLGQGRHQRTRVPVAGLGEQGPRGGRLHDAPRVHDGHAVGVPGDHAQVVGDEDDAHLVLVAQLVDEVEDLHLRRHVQGRGRLVGDEDARLAHQRHGDHDALAHAARQLVRVGVDDRLGAGHPHALEDLDGAGQGLLLRHLLVHAQRLAHLQPDLHGRVQAGERVLEDHADLRAAQFAHRRGGHLCEVLALQEHRPRGHAPALGEQAHQGQGRHGLAGAGLAHDAQGLAGVDDQVDARQGTDHAGADLDVGVEVLDF